MSVLWFVLLILRWPCAVASLVSLWIALFVLAGFGIACLIVFLFSFPPAPEPDRDEADRIAADLGPEYSWRDVLDGVGNRTPKQ